MELAAMYCLKGLNICWNKNFQKYQGGRGQQHVIHNISFSLGNVGVIKGDTIGSKTSCAEL